MRELPSGETSSRAPAIASARAGDRPPDDGPAFEAMRRSGNLTFIWAWCLPLLAYLLVALLSPVDVLDRHPGLRAFADFIHAALLRISPRWDIYVHARSTAFPQVAMLESSLAACLGWVVMLSSWLHVYRHREAVARRLRLTIPTVGAALVRLLLVPAGGFLGAYLMFTLPGDPGFALGLTTQSRLGYALTSASMAMACGVAFGFWPAVVRAVFGKR
jgi:hypothetical protein